MDSRLPSRRDKHRKKRRSLPSWFSYGRSDQPVRPPEPTAQPMPPPKVEAPPPPRPQVLPLPELKPAEENELAPDPTSTEEWPLFRPPRASKILAELGDETPEPAEDDFVVISRGTGAGSLSPEYSTPAQRAERLLEQPTEVPAEEPVASPLQQLDRRRLRRRRRMAVLAILATLLLAGAATGLLWWADWQPRLVFLFQHYQPAAPGGTLARLAGDHWDLAGAGNWQPKRWRGIVYANRRPEVPPDDHQPIDAILRDFQAITELRANLLIVPGLQPPGFYRALKAWNERHPEPLYLLQTLAPAADLTFASGNLQDQATQAAIGRDLKSSVQALRGQLTLPPSVDQIGGTYEHDVSPYVVGLVLDLPWERMLAVDNRPWPAVQTTLGQLDRLALEWGLRVPLGLRATPDLLLAGAPAMQAGAGFFWLAPIEPGTLGYATVAAKAGMELAPATYLSRVQQQWPKSVVLPLVGERTGSALVQYQGGTWSTYQQDAQTQATRLATDLNALRETAAGVAVQQYADDWSETAYGTADLRLPPSRRSVWSDPYAGGTGLVAWQPGGNLASLAGQPLAGWQKARQKPLAERVSTATTDPYGDDLGRRLDALYAHPAADGLDILVKLNRLPATGEAVDWTNTHLLLAFDTRPGGNAHLPYPHLPALDTGWETVLEIGAQGARVWTAAHADPVTWLWGQQLRMLPVPDRTAREDGDVWIPAQLPVAPALGRLPTLTLPMADGVTWSAAPSGEVRVHVPWLALGVMDPSSAAVPNSFWDTGKLAARTSSLTELRMGALTYRPDAKGAPAETTGNLWVATSLPQVTVDGYVPYAQLAQIPWVTWESGQASPVRRPAFATVRSVFETMAP